MSKNYNYNPPTTYEKTDNKKIEFMPWDIALSEITKEMRVMGKSERTIRDYNYHFKRMISSYNSFINSSTSITRDVLLNYLALGDVSNNTRSIRLKNVRPILKELYKRNYIANVFWEDITIAKTKDVRKESTTDDINTLFNHLDANDYVEFRDYVFIKIVYETGLRAGTMSHLAYDMFDFKNNVINVPATIMKGRVGSTKPIPAYFEEIVTRLHMWNKSVLEADERFLRMSREWVHLYKK